MPNAPTTSSTITLFDSPSPAPSEVTLCSEASTSEVRIKKTSTTKRKVNSDPLYEAALKRLCQKNEEKEQKDDKFRQIGKVWAEDLREIYCKNTTQFLIARKLVDEIISKAHFQELDRSSQVVSVQSVDASEWTTSP